MRNLDSPLHSNERADQTGAAAKRSQPRPGVFADQVLVKPLDSLQKRLLLCPALDPDFRVAPDTEAVLDAREEVDLPGLADLFEYLLGPVSHLVGENGVRFGGRNGQRARDGLELLVIDEGRVGDKSNVDARLVVADDILWVRR